ncbi:MAG: MarR family transcriptional regulator [Oscillospiraceae bacterium]|nr:MarR family transcriptional regulator [Oscillospiraceae bacterium]
MENIHQIQPGILSMGYMDSTQRSKKIYGAMLEPLCRRYDLTRNELDILLFLANNPGCDRAADIVSVRRIAKSHVSLSVGNLERRQLLIREYEEGDRRAAHLKLTEAAQPVIQEGQHLQKEFFTRMFDGLTRQELEQWGEVLTKICRNIDSMDI